MKTVVASLATALAVASGAGAYVATVTPAQFNALKAKVAAQGQTIATLQASVSADAQTQLSINRKLDCFAAWVNGLRTIAVRNPDGSTNDGLVLLAAPSGAAQVSCS